MENLQFAMAKFTANRKKESGIILKQFEHLRQLKGAGRTWAYSVSLGDWISDLTKKNNGEVVIKKENIGLNDLVVLLIDGDYFAVHFYELADYMAKGTSWNITKEIAYNLMNKKEINVA